MVKWKNRGCSRCGGTTFIEKDGKGWYEQCIMCSNRTELKNITDSIEHYDEKETNR